MLMLFFTTNLPLFSQEGAVYNSPTSGTLGGVSFTLSNLNNPYVSAADFSNSNFSYAPLSNSQSGISYSYNSSWSITFDAPIENLNLYCKFWRHLTVSFNHSFTLESGNNAESLNENTLRTTSFSDAIVAFSDPITTLTLTILEGPNAGDMSYQMMTFGTGTLSVDNFIKDKNALKLYPNPVSDFFQVSGITQPENYKIFNLLGAEVGNGILSDNKKIDTRDLNSGMYFLKMENHSTLKFIIE